MPQQADFISSNHGSIIALAPQTCAGLDWADSNIADPLGRGAVIFVEPRLFFDLAIGILGAGLTIQDEKTGRFAAAPNQKGL